MKSHRSQIRTVSILILILAVSAPVASRAVGRDDLICVTGSFYLVGDANKYLSEVDRKQNK